MIRGAHVAIVAIAIALHLHAQTPSPQPTFRGGTDLVQIDVSVLDGRRHPIRGLTAGDFTIFEDGQPRDIQAFTEVYLPDRVQPMRSRGRPAAARFCSSSGAICCSRSRMRRVARATTSGARVV